MQLTLASTEYFLHISTDKTMCSICLLHLFIYSMHGIQFIPIYSIHNEQQIYISFLLFIFQTSYSISIFSVFCLLSMAIGSYLLLNLLSFFGFLLFLSFGLFFSSSSSSLFKASLHSDFPFECAHLYRALSGYPV